jgi:hypothetical protein
MAYAALHGLGGSGGGEKLVGSRSTANPAAQPSSSTGPAASAATVFHEIRDMLDARLLPSRVEGTAADRGNA